jgi:hypothetical protein
MTPRLYLDDDMFSSMYTNKLQLEIDNPRFAEELREGGCFEKDHEPALARACFEKAGEAALIRAHFHAIYQIGVQQALAGEAAAALRAVTHLANAKAIQAKAETAPMFPLLKYNMTNAALLLSIKPRSFKELKRQDRVKTKQFGGHPMVMHAELMRLKDIDDPTPINLPKKAAGTKKPGQRAKLLALPKPKGG